MKLLKVFIILCLIGIPGILYISQEIVKEDYYKTGTLNWQNTGVYNKHTSLFVNINDTGDNSTYVWIGRNTEIEGLTAGDNVSIHLAFNSGKYTVVGIEKTE